MEKFLFVVSIVFGILSLLWAILQTYWGVTYPNSLEELGDRLKGYQKVFNPVKPFLIFLLCLCYFIYYMWMR